MKKTVFLLPAYFGTWTARATLDSPSVALPSRHCSSFPREQTSTTDRALGAGASGWREVHVSGPTESTAWSSELQTIDALVSGSSLLVLDGVASEAECAAIVAACSRAATRNRDAWIAGGHAAPSTVRLPSFAAVARELSQPESAEEAHGQGLWPGPVPADVDGLCASVLLRVLARLDAQWPALVQHLFGSHGDSSQHDFSGAVLPRTLVGLFERGALAWASREPSVNVYAAGGSFSAHQDGHALTVLVPLTPPQACTGGGTGFWSRSRARTSHPGAEPPTAVLKPEVGSALVFGGLVTHAGVSVQSGERIVLVASFSARDEQRPLAWFSD